MVTFLDVGLLSYFSVIFSALLVFAIVFAILQQTRVLGESKVINALIAIVLALLVLIYEDLTKIINFMSPWFVVVFIFLVLLLMVYRMFGISEQNIADYIRGDRTVNWVLLSIGIIIFLAAIFNVFGQRALQAAGEENVTVIEGEVAGPSFEENLFATIFHPKILGVILIFAIAVFAIAFLGGERTA